MCLGDVYAVLTDGTTYLLTPLPHAAGTDRNVEEKLKAMADVDNRIATNDGDLNLSLLGLADDEEDEEERDFLSVKDNPIHNAEPEEGSQEQHYFLRSIGCSVVIRQLPSEGLSFQLWPAAEALVSLMDDHDGTFPSLFTKPKAIGRNESPIRALELGAGTGMVGIAAAAIMGAQVVLTDLPHVVPNLQFNADANEGAVRAANRGGSVSVDPLRWGDPEDCHKYRNGLDFILASDVVYHSHLFEPLLQTIELLMGEETVLVMAHLRRWKKDAVFFKQARKFCDIDVIHRHPPFPGSRVGVIVYSFTKKRT